MKNGKEEIIEIKVNTDNLTQYMVLMEMLENQGYKWMSGDLPTKCDHLEVDYIQLWDDYTITHSPVKYTKGRKIYSIEEFLNLPIWNKDGVETIYVIAKHPDGIIIKNHILAISDDDYINDEYSDFNEYVKDEMKNFKSEYEQRCLEVMVITRHEREIIKKLL